MRLYIVCGFQVQMAKDACQRYLFFLEATLLAIVLDMDSDITMMPCNRKVTVGYGDGICFRRPLHRLGWWVHVRTDFHCLER